MIIRISRNMVTFFLRQNVIKEDEYEFYCYGYSVLLGQIAQTIMLLILGVILSKITETIMFVVVFTTVRRYVGGYHASTRIRCICLTTIVYFLALFGPEVIKKIDKSTYDSIFLLLLMFNFFGIVMTSPIPVAKKSILPGSISVNRRKSIFFVILYGTIEICFLLCTIKQSGIITIILTEIFVLIMIEAQRQKLDKK